MFKFFRKREDLPIKLFIGGSLCAFVLLLVFVVFLRANLIGQDVYGTDKYYFNKTALESGNDPMVTMNPDLKKVLSGPIISGNDPNSGNPNAPITIVEYSDFTCEFCHEQESVIKQAVSVYGDKVRLIWKDYPEERPVSISWQAAKAGRCADAQGLFWPYHELLFANSKILNDAKFLEIAKAVKLNESAFKECMQGSAADALIKDNMNEANILEITGVPFIYVNNEEMMGQTSFEDMKRIIDNKLKK
jgi:predicted DsbA family dithiol-disulfide isomerase